MTPHLGHGKHAPVSNTAGNTRNGIGLPRLTQPTSGRLALYKSSMPAAPAPDAAAQLVDVQADGAQDENSRLDFADPSRGSGGDRATHRALLRGNVGHRHQHAAAGVESKAAAALVQRAAPG